MRANDQAILEKTVKTGALVVAAAAGTAAVSGNNQLGLIAVISGAVLLVAHQLGAQRRRGSNIQASASAAVQSGLFDNKDAATAIQVENAARNVINGGAAIVDGVVQTATDCAAAIAKKK